VSPLRHFVKTHWSGDRPVAMPIPTHDTEKGGHTSVNPVGFEPMIPVFECFKAVHALNRAVIGIASYYS